MAPAVLQPDPGADENQRQVVVEDVGPKRRHDDEPSSEGNGDEQEPRQAGAGEVVQGALVERAGGQPRSARGTGFRGSGPMYSDCGRIMRLWAACSST